MRRWYIRAVAFFGGGTVLGIEILGTRLIGPFYGVSLYLWSALITVTLAALALGYLLGGSIADRSPKLSRLTWMLLLPGVWLLILPWIAHPLLALSENFGLRIAVLSSAALLFGPPLLLLGMVSPFVVRISTEQVETVGRTAGTLWALSTLGSVLFALLTGFILIPIAGVTLLTVLFGALLIVLAAAGFVIGRSRVGQAGALLLVLLAAGDGFAAAKLEAADPVRGLLAVRQSPYGELRVVDYREQRFLLIDGGVHSSVEGEDLRNTHAYAAVADMFKLFYDRPGRLLLIGLGAGSIARSYAADGWKVDAVEIDREIVALAREYFALDTAEVRVHVDDGRSYMAGDTARYDLVILDAFGSSSIPFHLASVEAMRLLRRHLAADGLLLINVESKGWHSRIVRSLGATLHEVFPYVRALPDAEPPDQLGNVLLLAAADDPHFDDTRLTSPYDVIYDGYLHWHALKTNHAWDNRFEPDFARGRVVTDDRNPVDLWAEATKLAAREQLHAYFGGSGLDW
jgi:spermidine synthase